MKISAVTMEAALNDFHDLQYAKNMCALFESFLVAKWLMANERYDKTNGLQVADANDAVNELFVLLPNIEFGRLYPFRFDWRKTAQSGRKTVWNTTTRTSQTLARSIFRIGPDGAPSDIRNGLQDNAAQLVRDQIDGYNRAATPRRQLRLPKRQSLACLVLRNHNWPSSATWADAEIELLKQLSMTREELDLLTSNESLESPLLDDHMWSAERLPDALAPPRSMIAGDAADLSVAPRALGGEPVVTIERRVERMLRQAIANYPFVLLVGPPGTGKGRLLQWILAEVKKDPESFGFADGTAPDAIWATPDEGWSSFELLGGLVPDHSGTLIRSPGLVVNALSENRWLVLDEINRADMDKIMGPLLTWLAGQEVEIGRLTPNSDTALILGWSQERASCREESTETVERIRLLAGRDWRLLGTYNPQDALRVFRLGLALSRRFVVVPIPIPSVGQFEGLLQTTHPELSDDVTSTIVGLYSAHQSAPETALGPAVFVRMAHYAITDAADEFEETLAEAYVINTGKYLVSYDDPVMKSLGDRIVEEEEAISREQWIWIACQREKLS